MGVSRRMTLCVLELQAVGVWFFDCFGCKGSVVLLRRGQAGELKCYIGYLLGARIFLHCSR